MAGRLCFELNPNQIAIRNVLTNKNFIEIEIYAISNANPNRNSSYFTLESMQAGIDTFIDKPILGFFNRDGDFEQHNGKPAYDAEINSPYWDNSNGEQILGFIREKDQREIVERDRLSWIRCTAMVCTQYNFKQVKRLLKDRKKKISVEVKILESEVIDGIEWIYKFELLGITILGSKNGIPISEGIEGAHLSVLDMIETSSLYNQRQALAFAYAELNKEEDKKVATEEFDTKKFIKVNKSKEAMSDTDWSEIDKTALYNQVVEAANFEAVAQDVFLSLREGWEVGEASKLKYPIMQFNGEEVVYNRGGLALAKRYAEKNGDGETLSKLKAIYEDLGIEENEEQECDASQFCDLYEDDDTNGQDDGHDNSEQNDENGDDNADERPEDKPDGEDSDEDSSNTKSNNSCQTAQMEKGDVSEEDKTDYKAQCEELTMKCEDYEKRCAEYEARCTEYEETCRKYNDELAKYSDYEEVKKAFESSRAELVAMKQKEKDKMKEEQLCHLSLLSQKMGLSEEEVKEVSEKCCNSSFNSLEEIDREVAYISWKKNYSNQEDAGRFAVNIVESLPVQKSTRERQSVQERLKKNLKK